MEITIENDKNIGQNKLHKGDKNKMKTATNLERVHTHTHTHTALCNVVAFSYQNYIRQSNAQRVSMCCFASFSCIKYKNIQKI